MVSRPPYSYVFRYANRVETQTEYAPIKSWLSGLAVFETCIFSFQQVFLWFCNQSSSPGACLIDGTCVVFQQSSVTTKNLSLQLWPLGGQNCAQTVATLYDPRASLTSLRLC